MGQIGCITGNVEVAYKRLEYSHVVKSVVCREHELSLGAWIRKDLFPLEASEHVTLHWVCHT